MVIAVRAHCNPLDIIRYRYILQTHIKYQLTGAFEVKLVWIEFYIEINNADHDLNIHAITAIIAYYVHRSYGIMMTRTFCM